MAPMGLVSQLNKLLIASGKVDTEVRRLGGRYADKGYNTSKEVFVKVQYQGSNIYD